MKPTEASRNNSVYSPSYSGTALLSIKLPDELDDEEKMKKNKKSKVIPTSRSNQEGVISLSSAQGGDTSATGVYSSAAAMFHKK